MKHKIMMLKKMLMIMLLISMADNSECQGNLSFSFIVMYVLECVVSFLNVSLMRMLGNNACWSL